jgi:Carboxypeptidase regulatory-like domain
LVRHPFLIPLGLALWSTAAAAVPVEISLSTSAPVAAGLKARLSWAAAQSAAGSTAVEVPGTSNLNLAPGAWTLHTELDGFWSEDRVLIVRDDRPETAEILLFPAGSLQGSFELLPGHTAPTEVSVRLRPVPAPPGGLRIPEATVSCPVAEGVWRCRLPAGDLDLRLKAGPYMPVYLWGVAVQAGRETPTGALRLRPGAAVAGWVETPEGVPAASCRVELSPQSTGEPADHVSMSRLEALLLEARTNDRGFFQVEAVPPGRYTLKVTSPGFATAEVGPVEVRNGLEAEVLDRIVLQRPVRFEALLDPPVDPYGQPWKIVLQARPPGSARFEDRTSAEGLWAQPEVAPGPYRLSVLGDLGSRWWTEEVDVGAGKASLLIQVPLVEIHGRLLQGDDPMSATLWFGGMSGARRIRFDADEDGEFKGFLPEEGLWKVELVEEDGAPRVGLEPVQVKKLPGAKRAEIEITVPDTTLAGEVVGEEGKPVSMASIQVDSTTSRERQKGSLFETDAEGKFRIRGLAPGPATVEAVAEERTSGWTSIVVADGGESPWLRLVVRSRQEVNGRIFSGAGAVPGARIEGFPDLGSVGVATGVEATSDPSGQFSFGLPAGARAVHLQVLALGFAFRILKAPVDSGQTLQIPLESQAGTLIFERAEPGDGAPPPLPLLFHGGSFVPVESLRRWVHLQRAPWTERGPLVVPGMEAGEYALCAGREAVGAALAGTEPPPSSCSRGFLAPFGELLLKAPGG